MAANKTMNRGGLLPLYHHVKELKMDTVVIGVTISMIGVLAILVFFIVKFIQVIKKSDDSSND